VIQENYYAEKNASSNKETESGWSVTDDKSAGGKVLAAHSGLVTAWSALLAAYLGGKSITSAKSSQ